MKTTGKLIIPLIAITIMVQYVSLARGDIRYWGKRSAHTPAVIGSTSFFPYGRVTASRQIMIMLNSTYQCDVDNGAMALGRFRGDIGPEILNLCKKGDYGLPGPVLTYIADYCGREGMEFIHSVLVNRNFEPSIRSKAAFAIGRKRYLPAVSDLLIAMRSREWIIRTAAARAIGIIGQSESKEYLIRLFDSEEDNRVLPEMAQALFRLGSFHGIPWLISTYKSREFKGIPGADSRRKLMLTAAEWPRYKKIHRLSSKEQNSLLENWIYEWEHGTLPPLDTIE
jgi:hypothetical protein